MNKGTHPYVDNVGTYKIFTYGCQMNAHESEKIAGRLESMGYRPVQEAKDANIIILNTCCVRDSAEQRIIGHIGTLKKFKESNPNLIVGVVGCMSQQEQTADRLKKTFPFLDIILGTQDLAALQGAILEISEKHAKVFDRVPSCDLNHLPDERDEGPIRRNDSPCAYVNIMYGCNNYCSYCIVPYVRGPECSRSPASIICELQRLEAEGYKDVTLLGQNVNSYACRTNFAGLLEHILKETGIPRIRFMTSHPKDLSEELLGVMGRNERICPHVHLPVQSGSDAVLRRMNRGYSRSRFLELVESVRTYVPGVVLTTDIIVGFPGETDADFEQTLSLVSQVRFDAAYTFVYSPRTGTKAAGMDLQVPKETKKSRIVRLIDLQNGITKETNEREVGNLHSVLVESISLRDPAHVCGRTPGGKTVNFPGDVALIGKFVPVRITEAKSTTLFGRQEVPWHS